MIIIPTPATLKCHFCERVIKKNTLYVKHTSKMLFHEQCYEEFTIKKEHRKDLLDYIIELQGHKEINAKIFAQIKDLEDKYELKLKGIELTLRYFHEIQGNPYDKDTIGIVPYLYNEAEKFHLMLNNAARFAQTNDYNPQEETVYINDIPPKKYKKLVDIEEIT